MLEFKIDEQWINEELTKLTKSITCDVSEKYERIIRGVIIDQVRNAVLDELKKPEYKTKLQELIKHILLDEEAKKIIADFIRY